MSQMNPAEKGEVVRVMAEKGREEKEEVEEKTLGSQDRESESEKVATESAKEDGCKTKGDSEKRKSKQQISAEKEILKAEKEKFELEKIELHKIAEKIEAERKRLEVENLEIKKNAAAEHENEQNRKKAELESEKKKAKVEEETERKKLKSEQETERKRLKLEQIRIESEKRKFEIEKIEKEKRMREDENDSTKKSEETDQKRHKKEVKRNKSSGDENDSITKEATITQSPESESNEKNDSEKASTSLKKDIAEQKSSKKFIKCKLCTKIVITNSYQEHLAKTHEITDNFEDLDLHPTSPTKKPHKCDQCPEDFSDSELLKTHMVSHSAPNTKPSKLSKLKFKCDKCNKRFRDERYLKMHHKMNTKCKTVAGFSPSFDGTDIEGSKKEDLSKNVETGKGENTSTEAAVIKRPKKLKCSNCEQIFTYKKQFGKHRRMCTTKLVANRNVKCKLCDHIFRKMNLPRHLRIQHDNYDRVKYDSMPAEKFITGEVSKKRRRMRRLDKSEQNNIKVETEMKVKPEEAVRPGPIKPVKCNLCSKYVFRIRRHVKDMHKDIDFGQYIASKEDDQKENTEVPNEIIQEGLPKPPKGSKSWCKLCKKDLKPNSYRKHMVRHLNEAIAAKEVALNDAKVASDDSIKSSENLETEVSPNLPSTDSMVVKLENIESVMEVTMEENVQDKCKLCYSLFENKAQLEGHVKLVHMDDMEAMTKEFTEEDCIFQCPKCNEKFFTANIRFHHVIAKHSSGKDALIIGPICTECDKTFSSKQALQKHKSTQHSNWNLLKPILSMRTPEKPTMEMVKLNFQELMKRTRQTEKKREDVKAEDDSFEQMPLAKEKIESLRLLFEEGRIEKSQLVEEVVEMVGNVGKVEMVEKEVVEDLVRTEAASVAMLTADMDDDCIPQMDPTLYERIKSL